MSEKIDTSYYLDVAGGDLISNVPDIGWGVIDQIKGQREYRTTAHVRRTFGAIWARHVYYREAVWCLL
jgi:hypothetical protein